MLSMQGKKRPNASRCWRNTKSTVALPNHPQSNFVLLQKASPPPLSKLTHTVACIYVSFSGTLAHHQFGSWAIGLLVGGSSESRAVLAYIRSFARPFGQSLARCFAYATTRREFGICLLVSGVVSFQRVIGDRCYIHACINVLMHNTYPNRNPNLIKQLMQPQKALVYRCTMSVLVL